MSDWSPEKSLNVFLSKLLAFDFYTIKRYINSIMNNTQTISVSQLRQNATQAINEAVVNQKPTIILQRSQPKAVLVDIEYFQALEEAVFDLTDAKEAEKAKKEKRSPLDSYLKKRWGKTTV
ncbi:hypothetical protein A3F58_04010 [Candidatus Roizmanbacteria bacterium RIFCSPHIGHO2_12_FULL_37_9b]|nr:MAG: hypothetical protein A3F58_04010 [Candidatus Roizmanbacteria bacterium RIFCSPHIGHO2_12_FULL_37_9b]